MKRSVLLFAFTLVLFGAGTARAGPCIGPSPFNDVAQNAIFCSDALWASNANVTLGCGGGNFCPNEAVTRAQMVLFLHRLAGTIFPAVLALTESTATPSGDLDTTGVTVCTMSTAPLTPNANGKFVHAHGVVSLRANASADVQLVLSRSENGGAFVAENTVSQIVSVPAGQWATASVMIGYGAELVFGSSYRWRIDLSRAPGSATTGELTDQRCQLKIHHQNDAT